MKEKILQSLKTKFKGVQDSILNRVAEKLGETVITDEQVETAVAGVEVQNLLDMYADHRANEASQTSVLNWRRKHNLDENGNPIQKAQPTVTIPVQPNSGQEEVPAWAQTVLSKINQLEQKQTTFEQSSAKVAVKQKLEAKLTEKKIPSFFLDGVDVSDESEIDSTVTKIEQRYLAVKQSLINDGIVIDKPRQPQSSEEAEVLAVQNWAASKKSTQN